MILFLTLSFLYITFPSSSFFHSSLSLLSGYPSRSCHVASSEEKECHLQEATNWEGAYFSHTCMWEEHGPRQGNCCHLPPCFIKQGCNVGNNICKPCFFWLAMNCLLIIWQYAHTRRDMYTSTHLCSCRLNGKRVRQFPSSRQYIRKKGYKVGIASCPLLNYSYKLENRISLEKKTVHRNCSFTATVEAYCQWWNFVTGEWSFSALFFGEKKHIQN